MCVQGSGLRRCAGQRQLNNFRLPDIEVGAIVAAILHTGLARLPQEGMAAEPRAAAQTPAE
jgi:hypothetical protein